MSKSRVTEIIKGASLGINSKLDAWLYSRIKSKKELGNKIYTSQLISEAIRLFKLKKSKKTISHLKKQIKKIKHRVAVQMWLRKKKGEENPFDDDLMI